jgi:hypothetical protein
MLNNPRLKYRKGVKRMLAVSTFVCVVFYLSLFKISVDLGGYINSQGNEVNVSLMNY